MKPLSRLFTVLRAAWGKDIPPNEGRMNQPPNAIPVSTETIPYTLTISGTLTVPAGTPREAVQAAVLSSVSLTVSVASSVKEAKCDTSGLTLAK